MNLLVDIPIEPVFSEWIIKNGTERTIVPKDEFLRALILSRAVLESSIRLNFPTQIIQKSRKNYEYLYKQIDPVKSDLFTLELVDWVEWVVK